MRNSDVVKKFKKNLVKAFFDMRDHIQQKSYATNLSRIDILKIAMESEQECLLLKSQIQEDAPKVAFAKQIEIALDAIKINQAAKIIGTGQNRLFAFMRKIGWVTRFNQPYQEKIEAGYLDVKLGNWTHPDHGLKESVTTLITGKGLAKLQALWEKHCNDLVVH